VNIRPATINDARAIAELLVSLSEYPNFQNQGLETMTARVTQNLNSEHEQQLVLVAELEERVVGYTALYWMRLLFALPEGYISELFVHTDASGHGVGTALLERLKAAAIARGCGRLTLINMTDRESYRRQFYASRGWVEQKNSVRFVLNLEVTA
jgi:GNAT superfamily N-acetyltransferase